MTKAAVMTAIDGAMQLRREAALDPERFGTLNQRLFQIRDGIIQLMGEFRTEWRRRFEAEARVRAARGKDVYPIDEALLAALPRLPPTAGIALGFDRLVMLALDLPDIRQVMTFTDA